MEDVLEVYQRPYDARYPVVCMDESSKQCVKETRPVLPMRPGQSERYDAEYERNGVAHLFMFCEPLAGRRSLRVADTHGALEWAEGVRMLVEEQYPQARKITLVMDNLNTHTGASLYKAFPPERARQLLEKLEFCNTPKHGSWLNIAGERALVQDEKLGDIEPADLRLDSAWRRQQLVFEDRGRWRKSWRS